MKRSIRESLPSAVYDGEIDSGVAEVDPALLNEFARISEALRVPESVAAEDPGFLVRFRARRDALRESLVGQSWRWLTLRLVPVAAGAVLVAGFVLFSPREPAPAFTELEMMEWGHGVEDVTATTPTEEPVLRIALGQL